MTNEEKAKRLEDMALIPVFLDRQDEALLREAAAHFRSLVPNEGGWLPCLFCGGADFEIWCSGCGCRGMFQDNLGRATPLGIGVEG